MAIAEQFAAFHFDRIKMGKNPRALSKNILYKLRMSSISQGC